MAYTFLFPLRGLLKLPFALFCFVLFEDLPILLVPYNSQIKIPIFLLVVVLKKHAK